MKDKKKALVSLSGGMDSATVLAVAIQERGKENVQAVSFAYGSKHNPHEIACTRELCFLMGVRRRSLDLTSFMSSFRSALTDPNWKVPEGHYTQENMSQTVVPNRNMIFLSILAGLAVSEGFDEIWLGVHAGDHAIYLDCRPEFIDSARKTIKLATGSDLELVAPFLYLSKKDILRIGYEYDVPYQHTRTCYTDAKVSCGKCGSCCERLEAFSLIGKEDPLSYQDREFYKTCLKP